MIEHLSSVIFNFDTTRSLSEDRHKDAFIDIFENTLDLAIKLFSMADTLKLRATHTVSCESLTLFATEKEGFIYSASMPSFSKHLKEIATSLYYSDNYSVLIHFVGYKFDEIVCMDPIYIAFNKNSAASMWKNELLKPDHQHDVREHHDE